MKQKFLTTLQSGPPFSSRSHVEKANRDSGPALVLVLSGPSPTLDPLPDDNYFFALAIAVFENEGGKTAGDALP